jgi:excisionase family DNA binding protein
MASTGAAPQPSIPSIPLPQSVSVHQLAKVLGVHNNTAYKLLTDGEIPSFRVGKRRLRVLVCDVQEFIAKRRDSAPTNAAASEPDAVDAWVDRMLATAPPLTDEQRTRLAELLRPVRKAAGAAGD